MKKVDIMISNGRILTLDEKGTLIEKGSVAIQGDSIVAVGACHDVEKRFEARDTINASKCLVMPGLVNGHTHAAMTCFRGIADDLRLEDWLNNYIFPADFSPAASHASDKASDVWHPCRPESGVGLE